MKMGGAERVVSRLANYWAAKGRPVTIITALPPETDFYMLDVRVKRISLQFSRKTTFFGKIASRVRGLVELRNILAHENPAVTIAFMTDMNIRLSVLRFFIKGRTIISERTNPARQRLNRRGRLARRLSYALAEKFVFVSEGVAAAYPWVPRHKRTVIYNPMVNVAPSPIPLADRDAEFISVGRLVPAKGFDLLIDAFKLIADEHPSWNLRIIGEGALRAELEERIARHGLEGRVFMPGKHDEPAMALAKAQIYVLSSRHEGFPNALVEAMCAGLPPVSFNCNYGPSEIIENGSNGLLVPAEDVRALANSMSQLATSSDLRQAIGHNAAEIASRLTIESIAHQWEKLF